MLIYGNCFLFFSLIIIISAIIVVSHRNQVIAALNLILCFFAAAGLFMLLGAEFIAMSVVVVYVGAVAVLFLFVVMMLDNNEERSKASVFSLKYIIFSIVLGAVLLIDLYLVFKISIAKEHIQSLAKVPLLLSENNIRAIGKVLYTDYSVAFIGSGVILLVAMLGSIVLTLKSGAGLHTKKQNINEQLARNKETGLKLVKTDFRKGIK